MAWKIEFTLHAKKDLRRLDATVRRRIDAALVALAEELGEFGRPIRCDAIKMQGRPGEWRLKIHDWRIIFEMDRGRLVVLVLEVGNRGGIY